MILKYISMKITCKDTPRIGKMGERSPFWKAMTDRKHKVCFWYDGCTWEFICENSLLEWKNTSVKINYCYTWQHKLTKIIVREVRHKCMYTERKRLHNVKSQNQSVMLNFRRMVMSGKVRARKVERKHERGWGLIAFCLLFWVIFTQVCSLWYSVKMSTCRLWAFCIHDLCTRMLTRFSRVRLFATLWTVAHQAPLSLGFSG